jgi:bifunctional non-homologous end joining protein LigD
MRVAERTSTSLDELHRAGWWSVGGLDVHVTNLDKVLFPGPPPLTKRDVLRYYAQVAPFLLPYLENRPVNANRFPDGVGRPGFWHKEVPDHAPGWLTRWHNTEADADETQCYAVLDSVPALVWMANFAGLELHPWTSRLPNVHEPTWALVDIDPGRTALEHLGVRGAPKVTGKRGVQIWIPVHGGYTFDDTRRWVEKVSRVVGRVRPELVSWEWYRAQRHGRARLDYTQNALNKTLVAPFSIRPAATAPVSVPITWAELDDDDLRPDRWTVRTVLDRLLDRGDPLAPLIGVPQELPDL